MARDGGEATIGQRIGLITYKGYSRCGRYGRDTTLALD